MNVCFFYRTSNYKIPKNVDAIFYKSNILSSRYCILSIIFRYDYPLHICRKHTLELSVWNKIAFVFELFEERILRKISKIIFVYNLISSILLSISSFASDVMFIHLSLERIFESDFEKVFQCGGPFSIDDMQILHCVH